MTQTKVLRLLSETERHPKVIKNMSVGVLGFVMHLSPADRSGYEVCPMRSEDNEEKCLTALKNGMNVAVVFRAKSEDKLPETWRLGSKKLRVIDGDLHDWRYGDYYDYPDERVIVGLRSKGSVARRDESGFIVDMPKSPEQQRMWDRSMKNADYQVERNRRIAMACA